MRRRAQQTGAGKQMLQAYHIDWVSNSITPDWDPLIPQCRPPGDWHWAAIITFPAC